MPHHSLAGQSTGGVCAHSRRDYDAELQRETFELGVTNLL